MEGQQPAMLRITTWNGLNPFYENEEYYAKEVVEHLHWNQERRQRVLAYLVPLDSDVYCLQEMNPEVIADIHKALGTETYGLVYRLRTSDSAKHPDGCATLYKRASVLLTETYVWRHPSLRHIAMACLFTCSHSPDKPIWIINTHVNWSTREEDLNALRHKLTRGKRFYAQRKVLMGDFNAERKEPWYQAMVESGFVDVMSEQQQKQWLYSFHNGCNSKWIDYMLLHFMPLESVKRTFVGNNPDETAPAPLFNDTSLPNKHVPSDHYAMTTEIYV